MVFMDERTGRQAYNVSEDAFSNENDALLTASKKTNLRSQLLSFCQVRKYESNETDGGRTMRDVFIFSFVDSHFHFPPICFHIFTYFASMFLFTYFTSSLPHAYIKLLRAKMQASELNVAQTIALHLLKQHKKTSRERGNRFWRRRIRQCCR